MVSTSKNIIKHERRRRAPVRVALGFQIAVTVGFLLLVLQVGFSTADLIGAALENVDINIEVGNGE